MELLPRSVSADPDDPEVHDVTSEDAGDAFDVLSSETARRVLAIVYDEPATPPEVREEVGTSLQNVHYHLERLEDADLVEPAGTGYSEKGNEMTVYAPASEAVVLFAGPDEDRSRVQRVLDRVFALVSGLSVAAVAADRLLGGRANTATPLSTRDQGVEGDDGAVDVDMDVAAETTDGAARGAEAGVDALGTLDPALLFFLGGLLAVAVLSVWWLRLEG
jgi:DNA-binding transcriptional ArsR family regulator